MSKGELRTHRQYFVRVTRSATIRITRNTHLTFGCMVCTVCICDQNFKKGPHPIYQLAHLITLGKVYSSCLKRVKGHIKYTTIICTANAYNCSI